MKSFVMGLALGLLSCGFTAPALSAQEPARSYVPPVSPRMETLRKELEHGNRTALENFWRQVAKEGTPLIEPIPGDDQHVLLTFLWRAKQELQNVVLMGAMTGDYLADNQLTHLPGTDLWHRTYEVRSDARFTYAFSLNDPLTYPRDAESEKRRYLEPRPHDPLNPHTFVYPKREDAPKSREEAESVVELSRAPGQPWITRRPDVPAGNVELHHFKSAILGNERSVWIYTPAGYAPRGNPYGLLVLFDGWWYQDHWIPTATILDNVIGTGLLPPLVAVLVDNFSSFSDEDERRDRELVNNPSFAHFVAEELVPWVRQSYHVSSDPARNIVGGLSYGGLAAAFVAWRHPEAFRNVLSQSGAFDQSATFGWFPIPEETEFEWLTRQYATSPRLPLRIYMEVGSFETGGWYQSASLLVANRHFRDVLQAKGYTFRYTELSGCNHIPLCWQGTLADGLIFLAGKGNK
jgi:enterochelin esterase family protein